MSIETAGPRKRINIILRRDTLRLLDRLAQKGNRSAFVDRAVQFYVKEAARANLRKQIEEGAKVRATRDLAIAEEWFPLDEEAWQKHAKR